MSSKIMSSRITYGALTVGMFSILLVGCQSAPQTQQEETAKAEKSDQAAKKADQPARKAAVPGERSSGIGSTAVQPGTAALGVTVPAGSALSVRLIDGIDTGTAAAGSSFEATLASPLVVGGVQAAAVGSSVSGRITNVVSSGRLSKPAELSLTLTSLTPRGGANVPITTNTWSMKGESHQKRNVEMIGGGAAAGAIIGAIAGGKKGAGIGTLIGGGGGTAVAAETGKKEIRLPSETKINFTLRAPVTLAARR